MGGELVAAPIFLSPATFAAGGRPGSPKPELILEMECPAIFVLCPFLCSKQNRRALLSLLPFADLNSSARVVDAEHGAATIQAACRADHAGAEAVLGSPYRDSAEFAHDAVQTISQINRSFDRYGQGFGQKDPDPAT